MASTRGRFLVLGGNPFHGSDALDSRMRACLWDLSLGQHTGDGKLGETFLGRKWMFFSGGGGGGEEKLQGTTAETFSQDDASSKQPCLCYILCISHLGFSLQYVFRPSRRGLRSSIVLGRHMRAVGMMFVHLRSMLLCVICLVRVYVGYMLLYIICPLYVYVCYMSSLGGS
jgi:hypothetical protein